jgi:hypothetical protein
VNDAAACVIERRLMERILYHCMFNFKRVCEIIKPQRISVYPIPAFCCSPYVTMDCLNIINLFNFFFAKIANYAQKYTSGFDGVKIVTYGRRSAPHFIMTLNHYIFDDVYRIFAL